MCRQEDTTQNRIQPKMQPTLISETSVQKGRVLNYASRHNINNKHVNDKIVKFCKLVFNVFWLMSLMSRGKKLFAILIVKAHMQRNLFPDGRREKSVCQGSVGSSTMLVALQMQRVVKMSWAEVTETLMSFSATLINRCRGLQSEMT